MEERRREYLDLAEVKSDIKLLLFRQTEIKVQVDRTNGRVTALEIWKSFTLGGLAVIMVMIVPVVIYVVESYISSK